MLLNRELVNRANLCLVSVFPDIVKNHPKIRSLTKIFLRSFENVGPGIMPFYTMSQKTGHWMFHYNFDKREPIFKILSPQDS